MKINVEFVWKLYWKSTLALCLELMGLKISSVYPYSECYSNKKEYRMVFASICEHASSVFIFASTSIWKFFFQAL